MKKKNLLSLIGVLFLAGIAWASTIVYTGYLANEDVAYGKTYDLDLKTAGKNRRSIDTVAATVAISSSSLPAVTWTDGGLSTGSFTVSSLSNIDGDYATNTVTVASTSSLKNTWVAVDAKRLRNGYEWKTKATTALTATDIARIMNYVTGISASAASNVVYATATAKGTASNSIALTKYGANLSVGAATFTGGLNPAAVTINGVTLTNGVDWTSVATTSGTAQAIVNAINAHASLLNIITATRSGSIVVLTANAVGVNAYTTTSNFAGITAGSAAMTGGSVSAYELDHSAITATAHGLTTGTPVLYSTAGFALSGLTNQTTYYAIRTSADVFGLATTSTGSVAGSYIVLASSSSAGPHTFTVTPTATTGTWGLVWKVSDDNSTWTNLSVSSVTFPSPYTAATEAWDMGTIGHRYLRLEVDKGTGGGIDIAVSVTGRNAN